MNFLAGAAEFDGEPFALYGPDHLRVLTLLVLLQVILVHRYQRADETERRRLRKLVASGLVAQEISYHVWRLVTHSWTVQEMLPLHLCAWSVWLGTLMLWTRSYRLYEYLYFAGTVGAGIALLMPDLAEYGPRHYRFWQFFASHGLIITASALMTFGEGMRPTLRSLGHGIGGTLVTAAVAGLANRALGSNYMFLHRKPPTASVLDRCPPWPRYLPCMAAAMVAVYGALYAPWALVRARA